MTRLEEYRAAYSGFEEYVRKYGLGSENSPVIHCLKGFQFAEFLLSGMERIKEAKTIEEVRGIVASRLEAP
jgi:hypothetical protein